MISEKYKYIFVHIPKSAGTSIQNSLLNFEGHANPYFLEELQKNKILDQYLIQREIRHKKLQEVCNTENIDNYFVFTFVRNPFNRIVSSFCYDYYANNKMKFLYGKDLVDKGEDISRDAALKMIAKKRLGIQNDIGEILIEKFRKFILNFKSEYYEKTVFRKQSSYFQEIKTNKNSCEFSKYGYDYVGRFENLEEDWGNLSLKICAKKLILPADNQTIHPHYKFFYDKQIEDKVKNIYQEDFEMFKYEQL